jgi:hypothetical protein
MFTEGKMHISDQTVNDYSVGTVFVNKKIKTLQGEVCIYSKSGGEQITPVFERLRGINYL